MPVIGAPPVLFQGRATANQTLATANTWYPVALGVEDVDDPGGHSTTTQTSRFVIPAGRGGLYRCSGAVVWLASQATTAGSLGRVIGITRNGSFLPGGTNYASYTGVTMTQPIIPFDVVLTAGDYIEVLAAAGLANAQTYGDVTTGSMLRVELIR